MSRPKRLNPNSFSHFITAQLFAGAHQGVFHRFGGAVQQLGCLGGGVPLQTGKQTAAFQGRKLRVDAFQHGGAALVGNGKLFRPRRGRIFRQGHTVVQRSMLLRVALRRASCCALAIQAAAYAVKGTFLSAR